MRKLFALSGACVVLLMVLGTELTRGAWLVQDAAAARGGGQGESLTVSAEGLYAGGGVFPLRRDVWGFRGTGLSPDKITILTMGGDATSQSGLPDEQTWQAVMERDLNTTVLNASGRRAVLANAGQDGQGLPEQERALRERYSQMPGLKPHFVLLQPGLAGVALDRPVPDFWESLRARSAILGMLFKPKETTIALKTLPDAVPPPVDAAVFKDGVKALAQASHAMGAVPVLLTQPSAKAAELNRLILAVCRDEGLLCLDLAREVTFETGDFYDYLHTTPQGAEKIGHWLAAKLAGLV